jgi:tetratricopeptide (TPR) repeat protein
MSAFFWLHRSSADKLIREAYAQHRTVEMRIPGAGYGPLRSAGAYRGPPDSSPQSLLEAQAMIKRGLEKTPDNAELLRQKAEADLLSWNFPEAMETLKRAAGIRPDAFALHADLAIAYFERAEAGANPADYEAALQSMDEALRLQPSDPAALFNRAILYERLYFYGRALADWEQFQKIEPDPGWREEAGDRLRKLRSHMSNPGSI